MLPMEQVDGDSNRMEGLHRPSSVNDLFAPLLSLNMHAGTKNSRDSPPSSFDASSSSTSPVTGGPDLLPTSSGGEENDAEEDDVATSSGGEEGDVQGAGLRIGRGNTGCPSSSTMLTATPNLRGGGEQHGTPNLHGGGEEVVEPSEQAPFVFVQGNQLGTSGQGQSSFVNATTETKEAQQQGTEEPKAQSIKNNELQQHQQINPCERVVETATPIAHATTACKGSLAAILGTQCIKTDGVETKPALILQRELKVLEKLPSLTVSPTLTGGEGKGSIVLPGRVNPDPEGGGGGVADPILTPSQSTSDDDLQGGPNVDEKKQKRMQSNRESARRSRLRKQRHLDDLSTQLAKLKSEQKNMTLKYNTISQRYKEVEEDNHMLRSHCVHLGHRIAQLHHDVQLRFPNGVQSLGIQRGGLDPFSMDHLALYSQGQMLDSRIPISHVQNQSPGSGFQMTHPLP